MTIVTPSYNQGRFIEDTIRSVLSQGYPRIEYIVMDGGSTDRTRKILEKYAARLVYFSEKDRGQSHAINKGFRLARGEILAWLNSDDTYLPGAVESAVLALQANPSAPFVYGEGYHIREDGSIMERYPSEEFSAQRLLESCFVCQPTVFMREAAVRRAGYLDESLNYCMDYDFWLRLSRRHPPVYLPSFLATSRLYQENKTLGQRRQAHWEIARMTRKYAGKVPSSWMFSLAHVILESRLKLDRNRESSNAAFVFFLIVISGWLGLYMNGRLTRQEVQILREWAGILTGGLRRKLSRSS